MLVAVQFSFACLDKAYPLFVITPFKLAYITIIHSTSFFLDIYIRFNGPTFAVPTLKTNLLGKSNLSANALRYWTENPSGCPGLGPRNE